MCPAIPNKLVTYDMDGAKKIEKYCDKCFGKTAIFAILLSPLSIV